MMLRCVFIAAGAQGKTYHVAQSSMIAGWPFGWQVCGLSFQDFQAACNTRLKTWGESRI